MFCLCPIRNLSQLILRDCTHSAQIEIFRKGNFTGADADVTTDGVATDYLMLPNKEVDSDGFYAKDGYLENVNVVKNDKQAIEGVVMFEEESPKG